MLEEHKLVYFHVPHCLKENLVEIKLVHKYIGDHAIRPFHNKFISSIPVVFFFVIFPP